MEKLKVVIISFDAPSNHLSFHLKPHSSNSFLKKLRLIMMP